MECREHCGACCIAPSINSAFPGMPNGKPAGMPCIQLDEHLKCKLFGRPERPSFCDGIQPSVEMCGSDDLDNPREHALIWLKHLEAMTKPN